MVGSTYNDGYKTGIVVESKKLCDSNSQYSHVILVQLQQDLDKQSRIVRVVNRNVELNDFQIFS